MTRTRARILVVDDERFFREAIVETLAEHDFQCDACEDGESAIEWMEKTAYAVVVLDITLPGIDGVETLRRLRESHPEASVIMLSASSDEELVLEALRLGACDYLAKPLHDEELILAVRRAIAGHTTLREWENLKDRLDLLADRGQELSRGLIDAPPETRSDALAGRAAGVVAEVLEARRASFLSLDDDRSHLRVASIVGHDVSADEIEALPQGRGVAWVCLQAGGVVCVDDIHGDPRFAVDPEQSRYDGDAFVIAPVEAAGQVFGVVCASDRIAEGRFARTDVALLRIVSQQLAELFARAGHLEDAIESDAAAATDEAEAEEGESTLDDLAATTAALGIDAGGAIDAADDPALEDADLASEICDAMIEEIRPELVLGRAVRALERRLGADPVGFYLFDPESGSLALEASGEHGLRLERNHLAPDKGLSGMVFQTGHLVATAEPDADPRFDFEADCPEDGHPGPLLCVPLRLRGKVVGIARVHLPEAASVSARTGEVLVSVLSAAIRNVLLYRSLLQSIEEVAVARREGRR